MELVTLTPLPGGFAEWPQSAWIDGPGRILIAQPNKRVPPAIFDSTGRFLQYIGREVGTEPQIGAPSHWVRIDCATWKVLELVRKGA